MPSAPPPPPPPPPPAPGRVVTVGDSVTSGHTGGVGLIPRTFCDWPTNSYANNLRIRLGVPMANYFPNAHSGATTTDVLATVGYVDPCGVPSQPVQPQISDARAQLAGLPSRPGRVNVAVSTAGVNDTNWTAVISQIVSRRYFGGWFSRRVPQAPAWAVANAANCTAYVHGAPGIAPAWNGPAWSGTIAVNTARTALNLISADPAGQVRQVQYYDFGRGGDPNLPGVCGPAVTRGAALLNQWNALGVVAGQILWLLGLGNPARIATVSPHCAGAWVPARAFIQVNIVSFGVPNWALVPGYPHPNPAGRAAVAACIDRTLPRAAAGGLA